MKSILSVIGKEYSSLDPNNKALVYFVYLNIYSKKEKGSILDFVNFTPFEVSQQLKNPTLSKSNNELLRDLIYQNFNSSNPNSKVLLGLDDFDKLILSNNEGDTDNHLLNVIVQLISSYNLDWMWRWVISKLDYDQSYQLISSSIMNQDIFNLILDKFEGQYNLIDLGKEYGYEKEEKNPVEVNDVLFEIAKNIRPEDISSFASTGPEYNNVVNSKQFLYFISSKYGIGNVDDIREFLDAYYIKKEGEIKGIIRAVKSTRPLSGYVKYYISLLSPSITAHVIYKSGISYDSDKFRVISREKGRILGDVLSFIKRDDPKEYERKLREEVLNLNDVDNKEVFLDIFSSTDTALMYCEQIKKMILNHDERIFEIFGGTRATNRNYAFFLTSLRSRNWWAIQEGWNAFCR